MNRNYFLIILIGLVLIDGYIEPVFLKTIDLNAGS